MTYTLKDVAEFFYNNRGRKRMPAQFSREEVYSEIIWADRHNKLHISDDERGLCGVVIASVYPATKRVYIHHIVCVRRGLTTFVNECFKRFPDYTIAGLINNRPITLTKRNLHG
jgi:hypothetical protein